MFEFLIGELIEKNPAYIAVKVGGVAFKVLVPVSTFEALPDKGEVKIYTELYMAGGMQDSAVRLYGFATLEERKLFQLLCTVQRIGPSTALQIISRTPVNEFRQAVLSENVRYLEKLKGVGAKTAQRIIIELKEPFSTWVLKTGKMTPQEQNKGDVITDAILALVSLGYPRMSAERVVRDITKQMPAGFTADELVKKSLKQI
jgi:Holliday junction DNA helicase RuvA